MATRPSRFFNIWGENGALSVPTEAKERLGWVAEIPSYQVMNWIFNKIHQAYLYVECGTIREWESGYPYVSGQKCFFNTLRYRTTVDHTGTTNPSVSSNWVLDDVTDQMLKTTDSPTFNDATIGGHSIDSELNTLNSRVNQAVTTTSSPTFSQINTGPGFTDVHPMNQDVRTSASPTFTNATIAGHSVGSVLGLLTSRVNQDVRNSASPTFANATIAGRNAGTLLGNVATLNSRVNQPVNTSSSPTFNEVTAQVFNATKAPITFTNATHQSVYNALSAALPPGSGARGYLAIVRFNGIFNTRFVLANVHLDGLFNFTIRVTAGESNTVDFAQTTTGGSITGSVYPLITWN